MIHLDYLKQLNRFSLALKKKVHSSYAGARDSRNVGSGLQFRDYRKYVEGDDFRKIDWRVYARTEKLYIKRYEEERNLTIHIIVDGSASMDFGEKLRKFDYAGMLGLGFAHIAVNNNEKFEFTTFSERLNPIKARKGVNQLISIVDSLNKAKLDGKSLFENSLAQYKKLITSKSLIIIISDFLFDIDELRQSLYKYKKSELFLIQVLDPVESSFSIEGDRKLIDAETKSSLKVFISNRLRSRYREKMEQHTAEIGRYCEQIGAKFASVTTDTDIFDAFYDVLRTR